MPHDVALITTIAGGFALAFIFGFIANRLGLPPLVGYLVAGIAVGPSTPGFVRRQRDGGAAGRNRSHAFDDRHWSSFFRGGLADGSRLR
jgi:Kef-type K+ transport system membrane component KefB